MYMLPATTNTAFIDDAFDEVQTKNAWALVLLTSSDRSVLWSDCFENSGKGREMQIDEASGNLRY